MSEQLAPATIFQSFLPNGAFNAGGQVFTYIAGTTTPQATFTDSTGLTPNTNPVILNAMGQAAIWLDPTLTYKFVVQDQLGNPLYTTDQINGALSASSVVLGPPGPGVNTLTVNSALSGIAPAVVINWNDITPSGGPSLLIQSSTAPISNINVRNTTNAAGTLSSVDLVSDSSTTNFSMLLTSPNFGSPFLLNGIGGQCANLWTFHNTPLCLGTNTTAAINISGTTAISMPGPPSNEITLNISGSGASNPTLQVNSSGATVPALNINLPSTGGIGLHINGGAFTTSFFLSSAGVTSLTSTGAGSALNLGVNGSGADLQISAAHTVTLANALGIFGNAPPAQVTGWGTPTGNAVIASYPGASATLVQTSNVVAQIITTLKAFGLFGA